MYQQGFSDMFTHNYYNRADLDVSKSDNKLKVYGQGIINVKPNAAEAVIGFITEEKELEIAQERNAKTTQQVIDSIKSMGVLSKDMQTQNYNIIAKYDYVDGKQVFRGYEVSNYLKIFITSINDIGEIIDTAVKNGANTVNGINLIVSDSSMYYNEALKLAVDDAQDKAVVMANKLKVKLNIIPIQIDERGRNNTSPVTTVTFKSADGNIPIEAGENKIIANIEAVFIYTE